MPEKVNKSTNALLCLLIAAFAVAFSSAPALATDANLTTNVSITNAAPTVGGITCDPISGGNFTPNVGSNKTLSCWAILTDPNGYGDINQSKFKSNIYNDTLAGADDLNTHYSNGSASNRATDCTWTSPSGNSITVNCSYYIRYFVTPYTGWTVSFEVNDSADNTGSNTTTVGIATTLGISVVNSTIEYGGLSLGGTSLKSTDIINLCNQQADVKLRESNNSGKLWCSGVGSANISTDNGDTDGIKYNVSSFTWPNGISLTSISTSYTAFNAAYYDATGTIDGISTKTLYWRIQVPSSGVSGVCSGLTEIDAVAG